MLPPTLSRSTNRNAFALARERGLAAPAPDPNFLFGLEPKFKRIARVCRGFAQRKFIRPAGDLEFDSEELIGIGMRERGIVHGRMESKKSGRSAVGCNQTTRFEVRNTIG